MPGIPEAIQRKLSATETVLWSGRPKQGIVFRAIDLLLIPFTLIWAGGAFFWEYSVLRLPHSPLIMKLWGIPFVVIGLYIAIGRFFVEARARQFTFYAVTNERALIVSGKATRHVSSLDLRSPHLSLAEQQDGTGSINFGTNNDFAFGPRSSWSGYGLYPRCCPLRPNSGGP